MKYIFALTILLTGVFSIAQDEETQHKIDSLSLIVEHPEEHHDTTLARAYLVLSEQFYMSNQDTVVPLCNRVIEICEEGLAASPSQKERASFLKSKSGAYNNTGLIYFNQGDIENTLKYFHLSLETDKEIGNKSGIGLSLNNLGYVYYEFKDYDQAMKYFNEALAMQREVGEDEEIALTLNNIGLIYYQQDDMDNALKYFLESMEMEEKNGNERGLQSGYANIAAIYYAEDDYENAIKYYQKAMEWSRILEDSMEETLLLYNMGMTYREMGKLDEAEEAGLKSLSITKEKGYPKNEQEAYELLSRVYVDQERGMEALEMYKKFIFLRDSLENPEVQNALTEQKLKYEFEKKEALAAADHEKEMALKEADGRRKTVIIWSSTIGLIMLAVFIVVIALRLRVSNRQKQVIAEKNEENELLLGEIHHRVKNNLQVISSLLSLQERNISDQKAKEAILEGRDRVQSIGLIHKHLYQNNEFSSIEMKGYITQLIEGLITTMGSKDLNIKFEVDVEDCEMDVDTAVPLGLMINELVVNAIKHAYADVEEPLLKVSRVVDGNQQIWEIYDNGEGVPEQVQKDGSFGMKLIRSLCRQLGAMFEVKRSKGLVCQIVIPAKK